MIDVNEILAAFFQKWPGPDADGIFHYLLQKNEAALMVDTTPHGQWTSELLKNTLIIDCHQDEMGLVWINDSIYRGTLGGGFHVETILYYNDEDEEDPHRRLAFVGTNMIVRIDLPPDPLSFWIGVRDFADQIGMNFEEDGYRVLS